MKKSENLSSSLFYRSTWWAGGDKELSFIWGSPGRRCFRWSISPYIYEISGFHYFYTFSHPSTISYPIYFTFTRELAHEHYCVCECVCSLLSLSMLSLSFWTTGEKHVERVCEMSNRLAVASHSSLHTLSSIHPLQTAANSIFLSERGLLPEAPER